ncbi:MAG: glycosyl hydrolase 115 family protein, partial [Cellvibrio sp.]
MRIYHFLAVLFLTYSALAQARPELQAEFSNKSNYFNFVSDKSIGDIVVDTNDYEVVRIAASLLQEDFHRVFDKTPNLINSLSNNPHIIAGTLHKSGLATQLITKYSINVKQLQDCFECYQFNYITHNGVPILLIVGADRRGTAYGLIEISRAIGVSPWVWWADVIPDKKSSFSLLKKNLFFNSPSVKYRGIFINDEDFGLLPWAAYSFEKGGNIGSITYEKVFELLLRLRANTLWPAMHKITKPFNDDPVNAKNAERYAIVMGSSHAEPMLRNNVGEWKAPHENYNFITHKNDILAYWAERLKTNAAYENLYTLGMRGIHDSGIVGVNTLEEKQALLNDILASQNQLLKNNVGDPQQLPQIFVPYKEVLDVYEKGLNIPDNVTLVWPDDNFGYLRRFADDAERDRSGGSGLYYHFSYLGAPLSYLWLSTIPLDLARAELTRAYDLGAQNVWIFNVGDIKPAEINLSHAMDLAWDIEKARKLSQKSYLQYFFTSNVSKRASADLAAITDEYYKLNYLRKPEHLQYYLPKESPKRSGMTDSELLERITRADNLIARVKALGAMVPVQKANALFELVEYPALASALAHKRFSYLELYAKTIEHDPSLGQYFGNQAVVADADIKTLT